MFKKRLFVLLLNTPLSPPPPPFNVGGGGGGGGGGRQVQERYKVVTFPTFLTMIVADKFEPDRLLKTRFLATGFYCIGNYSEFIKFK